MAISLYQVFAAILVNSNTLYPQWQWLGDKLCVQICKFVSKISLWFLFLAGSYEDVHMEVYVNAKMPICSQIKGNGKYVSFEVLLVCVWVTSYNKIPSRHKSWTTNYYKSLQVCLHSNPWSYTHKEIFNIFTIGWNYYFQAGNIPCLSIIPIRNTLVNSPRKVTVKDFSHARCCTIIYVKPQPSNYINCS